MLEIFITHFILYTFKIIYNLKIKLSVTKNVGDKCTILI